MVINIGGTSTYTQTKYKHIDQKTEAKLLTYCSPDSAQILA